MRQQFPFSILLKICLNCRISQNFSLRNFLELDMKPFDFEISQWFSTLVHKMKVQNLKPWPVLAKLNLNHHLNRIFLGLRLWNALFCFDFDNLKTFKVKRTKGHLWTKNYVFCSFHSARNMVFQLFKNINNEIIQTEQR